MTWYKTGTVNVTNNSATVTGSGTAFVANVQVGEEFRLAGGQRGYEITAVVSDTQLTIDPPYMDSSQNGASYRVVPVRGFVRRTYNVMSGAMSQWDDYRDGPLSGLFEDGAAGDSGFGFAAAPGTGWFRDGSGNMAGQRLGATKIQLLAGGVDITGNVSGTAVQVSGFDATAGRLMKTGAFGLGLVDAGPAILADIDSVAMPSGTHRTDNTTAGTFPTFQGAAASPYGVVRVSRRVSGEITQEYFPAGNLAGRSCSFVRTYDSVAGAWIGWRMQYNHGNILAPVSQSAGVPTGGLIERGSNASGAYVRFADGTQICTHVVGLSYGSANILSAQWNYPASFSQDPFRAVNMSNQPGDYVNVGLRDIGQVFTFPTGTATATYNVYRAQGATGTWDGTSLANNARVFAIGRWF